MGPEPVPAFLQMQKPDLYWTGLTVRIAVSEDLSEPEPFGTRSVWQSLRIQTAVEISAQVSFHTSYDGARASSDWKRHI